MAYGNNRKGHKLNSDVWHWHDWTPDEVDMVNTGILELVKARYPKKPVGTKARRAWGRLIQRVDRRDPYGAANEAARLGIDPDILNALPAIFR